MYTGLTFCFTCFLVQITTIFTQKTFLKEVLSAKKMMIERRMKKQIVSKVAKPLRRN
jgi:hypothetical protein